MIRGTTPTLEFMKQINHISIQADRMNSSWKVWMEQK